MRRFTAALLTCLMLVGLMPTASAAQISDQQIIDTILVFFNIHEGNYGSINPNDNGALSIGKVQWHAGRALNLVRKIEAMNSRQAQEILEEELYIEVMDPATNWSYRTLDEEESARFSALLTTPEGKKAQDEQANSDMAGYIKDARNLGITDPTVTVYFCDLHNQGGLGMARRVTKTAIEAVGSADAVSLEAIHQAGLEDSVAGRYPNRRNATYEYCKSLGWSSTITSPTPPLVKFPSKDIYWQGKYPDVPANQWYTKNVAAAVNFGLMKGLDTGAFAPNGTVTVAQAVTMAARIHAIHTTGSENFRQTSGALWYQVYYDYAYSKGIITAAHHWNNANQPITRAAFAEILAKALPGEALYPINSVKDNAIPDVPSSASYAGAVYTLYRAGILTGNEHNQFQPSKEITRAQVAAIVSRMADSSLRMDVTLK